MPRRRDVCCAFISLVLVCSSRALAQSPSSDDVLTRATRYVDNFVSRFTGVVAEERYRQEMGPPTRQRELRSDFLLVKPPESSTWYQFRDVIEVDGQPVPNRQERLAELFTRPTSDAFRRADQITRDSAQYNLANIGTLNRPLTVLGFLQAQYRGRFRFWPRGIDAKVGPTARLIEFREVSVPTIFSRQGIPTTPATGQLWVDEESGAVLQTHLLIADSTGVEIYTVFEFNADLGVYVPVQMRERYGQLTAVVTGIATYTNFRRFQITTEERLR